MLASALLIGFHQHLHVRERFQSLWHLGLYEAEWPGIQLGLRMILALAFHLLHKGNEVIKCNLRKTEVPKAIPSATQ
jgi:hypothetical protein